MPCRDSDESDMEYGRSGYIDDAMGKCPQTLEDLTGHRIVRPAYGNYIPRRPNTPPHLPHSTNHSDVLLEERRPNPFKKPPNDQTNNVPSTKDSSIQEKRPVIFKSSILNAQSVAKQTNASRKRALNEGSFVPTCQPASSNLFDSSLEKTLNFVKSTPTNPEQDSKKGTLYDRPLFASLTPESGSINFWNPSMEKRRPTISESVSTQGQSVTGQNNVVSKIAKVSQEKSWSSTFQSGSTNHWDLVETKPIISKSTPIAPHPINEQTNKSSNGRKVHHKQSTSSSTPQPSSTNNWDLVETKPIISKSIPIAPQPINEQINKSSNGRKVHHKESTSSLTPQLPSTNHWDLVETKPIISKNTSITSQPVLEQASTSSGGGADYYEEPSSSTSYLDANYFSVSPLEEETSKISEDGDKTVLRSEMIQFLNDSMDEIRGMINSGNYKQAAYAALGNLAYKRDKWLMEIEDENAEKELPAKNLEESSTSGLKRIKEEPLE